MVYNSKALDKWYTAISTKVVGKKCTQQSRKIMCVILVSRFLDFSISVKFEKLTRDIHPWHLVPFFHIFLKCSSLEANNTKSICEKYARFYFWNLLSM